MIVIVIIKAIFCWLVLAFIGTNLIGFFMRNRLNIVGVVSIFLMGIFFFLLLRYLHSGVAIAATMLLIGRIPDLIWALGHRQKISDKNKKMPNRAIDNINLILLWGALPVLFWAFYSV